MNYKIYQCNRCKRILNSYSPKFGKHMYRCYPNWAEDFKEYDTNDTFDLMYTKIL